jgi:hypothetical protein
MDSKITKLALDIGGLIQNFVKNEVSVYKENYDHMMNSPLFNQLRTEVETLRAENLRLSKKKNNIELEINDESEDTEYDFDRKYKNDVVPDEDSGLIAKAELNLDEEYFEQEEEEDVEEVTVEVTDEEEEVEEVEVTEEDNTDGSTEEEEKVEEVEVTEEDETDGSADEGSDSEEGEEVEEVEFTEDEEFEEGEEVEEVEVTEDEEEEVMEFEYKGVQYFITDEENGDIYANVDDDIGEIVGKIKNKNVILFHK